MKPALLPNFCRRRRSAFSLLEILVAVGLLATIIVGLLSMFYQTQKAFRSGATQADVLESGRAIMELLVRELQEVTASKSSSVVNLIAAVDAMRAPVLQPLPGGGLRENQIQDISFLSRVGDEWKGIAYRVGPTNSGAGTLYRLLATSNNSTNSFGPPPPYPNVAALSSHVTLATLNNNANFHRVADGIVHLRLRAYDTNGVLITSNNIPDVQLVGGYIFSNQALPAYVDLELGILEPKALSQFKARSENPARALAYLTNQVDKVHLFRQRIPIRTVQ